MTNRKVDGTRTQFPLFHGTSSIFIESIKEHGLGGKNLIEELDALATLKALAELCALRCASDHQWQVNKDGTQLMIQQHVGGANVNYRHGQTYFTTIHDQARDYSKNKFGSELLTRVSICAGILQRHDVSVRKEAHPALRYLGTVRNPQPVILRIGPGMPVRSLKTETGAATSVVETVNRLNEDYRSWKDDQHRWHNIAEDSPCYPVKGTFQLCGVVPWTKIESEYIGDGEAPKTRLQEQ